MYENKIATMKENAPKIKKKIQPKYTAYLKLVFLQQSSASIPIIDTTQTQIRKL